MMKEVRWHGSSRSDVEAFPHVRREALFQIQIGENPSDWKPMPSIDPAFGRSEYVRRQRLPNYLPGNDQRGCSRAACIPEENAGDDQTRHRPRQSTIPTDQVTTMTKSFHDLFLAEEATELEMRAKLLSGINKWLNKSGLIQIEAAEQLGVTQARVSEIKNGKINRFS